MSRKIDALIAEHVMGLESGLDFIPFTGILEHEVELHSDGSEWMFGTILAKRYSTDISAAWEVVEKMTEHYDAEMWSIRTHTEWTQVYWSGPIPYLLAESDTAPMAICLAALEPKGMEESK